MKKISPTFFSLLTIFMFCSSSAIADDLERLAGKWSLNKTNAEGQAYSQTIEIKKDKFTFKIVGSDDKVRLYAEGEIKLEKLGPFQVIAFTKIKAGQSASELEPVDDDRTSIYQLGDDTWTLGSNFDKERNQKPSADVYKKVAK